MPSRAKRRMKNAKTGEEFYAPAPKREKENCKICKKPMLVAPGQIAKYHKACRAKRHNKINSPK